MTNTKLPEREKQTADLDWSKVRRRVEAAQALLERGWAHSPEEKKALLKARAKALAQEAGQQKDAGALIDIVEFSLAYENYGLETKYVREVYPLRELTPLPATPPFVLGVVNLRGQMLSIIDLKRFFDLPEKGLGDLNKIIVLRNERMEFGILADFIIGIRLIPAQALQPSLPTLTGIRAEYLRGVTGERLAILDAAKILSDKKIVVHEEVGK